LFGEEFMNEYESPIEVFENVLERPFIVDGEKVRYRDHIASLDLYPKPLCYVLPVDINHVFQVSKKITEILLNEPRQTLETFKEAIMNVMERVNPEYRKRNPNIIPRIFNVDEFNPISIRYRGIEHHGKLVAIEGNVVRVGTPKDKITNATFWCAQCESTFSIEQDPIFFHTPKVCRVAGCGRKGPFKLVPERSKFIEAQRIVVRENTDDLSAKEIPRSIDVLLIGKDLVNTIVPGVAIKVSGILMPVQTRIGRQLSTDFETYLMANHISISENIIKEKITDDDIVKIRKIAESENPYEVLINSVAPSIYGYEDIKEAIVYLLFGGTAKVMEDGMRIRGDSHILLVGDPGTGKSQILQSVKELSNNSIYTSGKGSTAAGLTAAVIRDSKTKELHLEAGALVIADKGTACIDEFEKMNPNDQVAIHQAMEQQQVSIAKAGILADLNARTSILAAANPTYGRYDYNKTVADNVKKLPPTVLSRFDTIFILQDIPNEERDTELAKFIVGLHAQKNVQANNTITPELFRKYRQYARENCKPQIKNKEVEKRIVDFFVKMRKVNEEDSAIAISSRQLESVVRFSEAHAKVALRNEVIMKDVEAAIKNIKVYLRQVAFDPESNTYDIDAIAGKPKGTRNKMKLVENIVLELCLKNPKVRLANETDIMDKAIEAGIEEDELEEVLIMLKRDGLIFEPVPTRWKSADRRLDVTVGKKE
jgi:replicative DNA helicase Mcm